MLAEQKARSQTKTHNRVEACDEWAGLPAQSPIAKPAAQMNVATAARLRTEEEPKGPESTESLQAQQPATSSRDPNVSNETWEQLQRDIEANQTVESSMKEAVEARERAVQQLREDEGTKQRAINRLENLMQERRDSDEKANELRRRFDQERLQALAIKRARDEKEASLKKFKEEEARRRQKEVQAQQKLKDMGVCPVGFRWIKQSGGYRCAGGTHYVTDSQLGI